MFKTCGCGTKTSNKHGKCFKCRETYGGPRDYRKPLIPYIKKHPVRYKPS